MSEINELAELYSPSGKPVLEVLMVLQKTHAELLNIYDEAINQIKRGVYAKNKRGD